MKRSKIDVYLIQETWLEGEENEYDERQIGEYTVFLHGTHDPDREKRKGRGRDGVAIFLSSTAKKAL